MGWNYLSIPKLQRSHHCNLGMDAYFHAKLYWAHDYLSMVGLKLNHVDKRGPMAAVTHTLWCKVWVSEIEVLEIAWWSELIWRGWLEKSRISLGYVTYCSRDILVSAQQSRTENIHVRYCQQMFSEIFCRVVHNESSLPTIPLLV